MIRKLIPVLLLVFLAMGTLQAQTTVKKVVLQGFWWDYWNDNHPNSWANYLTELAPRLRAMGVDAVWIPPSYKNTGTNSVGYSPFDHYDLGDKYQKGSVTTRVGTKDELLRMIAVLHANGIEVIQDVVLNHADGAGTTGGQGGQDPEPTYSMATNGGYKNFRYVSYETPIPPTGENATEYLARKGRWSKNYQNFHPTPNHNVSTGDWESPYWGPDFAYGIQQDGTGNGYGTSTNATYNPTQSNNYNRDQARQWMIWFKKQTGVDGYRWDAVKHFPHFVVQDISYNIKYLSGWASQGQTMLNFGEYVGGGSQLDAWVNNVAFSNGGSDKLVGAIDFGLRGALYNIINGNGGFDMSTIPGTQQQERVTYYPNSNTYNHITVPFVNSHDTYRPIVAPNGNITGWNTGQELAPHIDPNDGRLSAAYAVAIAVDGNPLIFFEDVFNVNNTGKRFSHEATSMTDLPQNGDIENLIWCHQNLDFKSGVYKIRGHSGNQGDHLVIERSAKALIGVNDNWTAWQTDWVDSDFPPGTVLMDYGGSTTSTATVQPDQRVQISTPPCDGSATRRGYSVWAPIGQSTSTYTPPRTPQTTQEWEMADDLGDSHCNSLGQGGRLPDMSTGWRTVGRIFPDGGTSVTVEVYPEDPTKSITLAIYDVDGVLLKDTSGIAPFATSYTPPQTGWFSMQVRNTLGTHTGQKCWIKATYTAPLVVDTDAFPVDKPFALWTGSMNDEWENCRNWFNNKIPTKELDARIPSTAPVMPTITGNASVKSLFIESGATLTMDGTSAELTLAGDWNNDGTFNQINGCPTVLFDNLQTGAAIQYINNSTTFCKIGVRTLQGIELAADVTATDEVEFIIGKIFLEDFDFTVEAGAILPGAGNTKYFVTKNDPASGGTLIREVGTSGFTKYPIGSSSSYTPAFVKLNASISAQNVKVRAFDGVYDSGNSGSVVSALDRMVNRTWEITSASGTALNGALRLQWNSSDEGSSFDRTQTLFAAHFNKNTNQWDGGFVSAFTGSNPYAILADWVNEADNYTVSNENSVVTNTAILNTDKTVFFAFPNPSAGRIQLQASGNYGSNLALQLYSADGRLIFGDTGSLEGLNEELTHLQLSSGIYFMTIMDGDVPHQVKFVVE